jgi:hypothetical protein
MRFGGIGKGYSFLWGQRPGRWNFDRISGAVGESIQGQSLVRSVGHSLWKGLGFDRNATCGATGIFIVET